MNSAINFLTPPVLVLFVYSGMLKWLPFPFDPTLLFGLCVVMLICARLASHDLHISRDSAWAVFLILAYLFLYFTTVIYTESQSYWKEKAPTLLLDALAFCGGYYLLRMKSTYLNTIKFLTIFVGVALFLLLALHFGGVLELLVTKDSLLPGSRLPDYLGIGSLICVGILLFSRLDHLVGYALVVLSFFILLKLGARGPTLSIVLVLAVLLFTGNLFRSPKKKLLATFIGVPTTLLFMESIFAGIFSSRFYSRFTALFEGGEYSDRSFRVEEFNAAFRIFSDYPFFGSGLGSYGIVGFSIDADYYPHNIILEALSESGIFGGSLFMLGVLYVVILAFRARRNAHVLLALSLLAFTLMNYMKSGGFIGARDLYFFLGLALAAQEVFKLPKNRV